MSFSLGAATGERKSSRDVSLGYASAASPANALIKPHRGRSRRVEEATPREKTHAVMTARGDTPPREAPETPPVTKPRKIADVSAHCGSVFVYATVAAESGLELYNDITDSTSSGTICGRPMLFYPMVTDEDGRVFMQHRVVNQADGTLSCAYAKIQDRDGPPLVSNFSLETM